MTDIALPRPRKIRWPWVGTGFGIGLGLIIMAFATVTSNVFEALITEAVSDWETQGASGCSDQYGSFDAFIPGMRGFGTCNRGGFVPGTTVIRVQNTNSSGTGSLDAAANASCPKVILFGVSGLIDTNGGSLDFNNCDNWSVVGASAPGNVTISGTSGTPQVRSNGDNWTLDNLILAPGDTSITPGATGNRDAWDFEYANGGDNGLLMNNAFLWGTDETLTCYSISPMTNVTYWQNITGVGVQPNHNLNFLIGSWCTRHSAIRNLMIHQDGRNPVSRADDLLIANNLIHNPGFQSIALTPCGTGSNQRQTVNETNIIGNIMVRGPNTSGHQMIDVGGTFGLGCLTPINGNRAIVRNFNNKVEVGSTGAITNCSTTGCASDDGATWATDWIPNATSSGYVPETIGSTGAGVQEVGERILEYVGPRPSNRLAYISTLVGEAQNGLDQSGSMGSFATGSQGEGGISAITPASGNYDPRDANDNPCGVAMPTGTDADEIQTGAGTTESGLTKLHEWVITCFYDNVMPSGYREAL